MRIPTFIMVHHSLTKDSGTVSWPAIEKYHKEINNWSDIGYHMGVENVTINAELWKYKYQALVGRAPDRFAAACPQGNMNNLALHVVCIGNYDIGPPSPELLDTLLKRVILPWSREYGIPPENWVGHRDFNPEKTCPGKMFNMELLREMGR